MSAIFKTRKIPRHLIIEPETPWQTKPRLRPWRLLLGLLLVLLLTGLLLHYLPVDAMV